MILSEREKAARWRLLAILGAVGRAAGRGSRSLWRVSGNNILYAGVTLLFMTDPGALVFFVSVLAVILFIPSSSDPMTAVPSSRLDAWPLNRWERIALRVASPLLNPMTWLLLAALAWKRMAWSLWAMLAAFFVIGFCGSSRRFAEPWVPRVAVGGMLQLVRKDLRQFLTALDFYCALMITLPALGLRISGHLPSEARVPLTGLVTIFLSTMALTLFGLDGGGGMTRYRLLPLWGWQVLLSKAAAYLIVVLVLTAPLSPIGGLSAGLLCLAVGQYVSLMQWTPQARWRFRASHAFGLGIAQMVLALLALGLVANFGAHWLGLCVAIYAISLRFCRNWMPAPC